MVVVIAVVMGAALALAAGPANAGVLIPAPAGTWVHVGTPLCGAPPYYNTRFISPPAVEAGPIPAYANYSQYIEEIPAVESSSDGVHWSQPLWSIFTWDVAAADYVDAAGTNDYAYIHTPGLYWRSLVWVDWYVGSTRIGTYEAVLNDYAPSVGGAYIAHTSAGYSCLVP